MIHEHHLEWALMHLEKFGGSDVFPPSHDYIAIRHNWDEIKRVIFDSISRGAMPGTPYLGMAPKSDNTFRAVHELSPLDNILITAIIYSITDRIERGRFPEERRSVYSFRLAPDHEGRFFKEGSDNWSHFAARRNELMTKYASGYVLKADISDYYNQIYLHRVQNALDECLPAEQSDIAEYIHDFLLALNTKVSKGIPVGPAFSTIIAEIVLNDVDQKISSYGFEFVRWVDDIFVFHADYWYLHNKYQELSEYLYSTHRLIFNGQKTRLSSVQNFQEFLEGNEDKIIEKQIDMLKDKRCAELLEELMQDLDPYAHSEIDTDSLLAYVAEKYKDSEAFNVVANAYKALFEQSIETNNTTLLKHVLKKCTAARIRSIAPIIRNRFGQLFPVIREVAFYARRTYSNEMLLDLVPIVISFCISNENKYTLRWLSYILTLPEYPDGHVIDNSVYVALELRDQLTVAARHGDLHRIKAFRTKIDQIPESDRYSLIIATNALTRDERIPILDAIESRRRPVDVAYCRYVRSGITNR